MEGPWWRSSTRQEIWQRVAWLFLAAVGGLFMPIWLVAAPPQGHDNPPQKVTRFNRIPGFALEDELKKARLAILPLGSIEYHGPSGPLGTDSLIASGLAERLAARLGAVLLPTVDYTHSPAHTAAFRGTVTIRPETMTTFMTDILTSLVEQGFDKVFILNGDDGNIGAARLAISQVTHEHRGTAIMLVSWWETLPGPLVDSLHLFDQPNGGHGHGGPLELSVAAVFAPDAVVPGKGPDLPALEGLSDGFPYYLEKSHAEGWPGYSGKLSEISAEKGERLAEIAEERLARLVEAWLANPDAPGSW
jgi:creatinine amidohydrolase